MSSEYYNLLKSIHANYVSIDVFNKLENIFIRQSDAEKYLSQSDSGWNTVNITNENFQHYANSRKAQYRKIGKLVEIRGAVTNKTDIIYTSVSIYDTIFTMPSGFRPSQQITTIQQGSNLNTFMLTVDINGNVDIGRYRNNNGDNIMPENSWLNLNVVYFVD